MRFVAFLILSVCALRAETQEPAPLPVVFGSAESARVYATFVAGTHQDLVIHTPSIAGNLAIGPLAELHEHNARAKITILVEGPEAIAQRTPQLLARITLSIYAIPPDPISHRRPFHITSTWLVRDGKDILILPNRLEFRTQIAPDANIGVFIKDDSVQASNALHFFLMAQNQGQQIMKKFDDPVVLAPAKDIRDKEQETMDSALENPAK